MDDQAAVAVQYAAQVVERAGGARNTGVDATGQDYRLIIPTGVPFNLWLFSTDVVLTDASGARVDTSGSQISFQAGGRSGSNLHIHGFGACNPSSC